jgi:hypothetical protein
MFESYELGPTGLIPALRHWLMPGPADCALKHRCQPSSPNLRESNEVSNEVSNEGSGLDMDKGGG